ncbi:MAG: septum formation initiator family protein [Bacteroidia bacterium]|jgi:cell division protein FtsB|nr:septum formation initiator family protein [Bacteroidia bacterium]
MIILKLLKNKYFLVIVGLFFWLLYFDKNDVFTQYELIKKCNKLNSEKDYYIAEIENNKKEVEELQSNLKSLETFAREKYLMKRDNEDVFVFVQK